MKKSILSMLAIAAIAFGMASCNGAKKANEAQTTEDSAVVAGNVPKDLLTVELKQETTKLLEDMPSSDIPYRLSTGDIKIAIGNIKYMLPVSKAAELTTPAQKSRALGIYIADINIQKVMKQPTTELESAISKLAADLNVTSVLDILKEPMPVKTTKDELNTFMKNQEKKIVDKLAEENKMDVAVEIMGGAAAENACLLANPSLVIKGDATSAGLSDNMVKRIDILGQVISDLSNYYPDLKQLSETIIPLKEKVATIQAARAANADIMAIRDALVK
ncbi:MAG: hypothetical protein PHG06_02325 [Parabacteroides sp.]|nr:hypothetical protein [Parabacteroides sp.]